MKPATIFSVPTMSPHGYVWKWRADDGKTGSSEFFAFYYDCLEDARHKGYGAQPERTAGGLAAPGENAGSQMK